MSRVSRISRISRIKLAALGSFLVFLIFAAVFLYSSVGLRFVLGAGELLSDDQLSYTSFSGNLATGWVLEDTVWRGGDSIIEVSEFGVDWNFWHLLQGALNISSFEAHGVKVTTSENIEEKESVKTSFSLGDISLPLSLVVHSARMSDLTISDGVGQSNRIEEITVESLQGEEQKISVKAISVKGQGAALQASGKVEMNKSWPLQVEGKWQYSATKEQSLKGTLEIADSLANGKAVFTSAPPIDAVLHINFGVGETIFWKADLQGKKVDPSILQSDLMGELNLQLEARGQHDASGTEVELDIDRLDGVLNDVAVVMSGKAKTDGKSVRIDSLLFNAGKTKFSFTGTVGQEADVDFTLISPDIGEIYPAFSGKIDGGGHIGGRLPEVKAEMNLKGENLDLGELAISSLNVEMSGRAGSDEGLEITLLSQDLRYGEKHFEKITVHGTGDIEKHSLKANFSHTDMQLEIQAEGAMNDGGWSGQIFNINGHHQGKGNFALREPARLLIGPENYSLDDFCLDSNGGALCLNGAFHKEKWRAKIDLDNFDPELFFADWPGAINALVFIEGELSEKERDIELEFTHLDGKLRNIDLFGSGTVKIVNDDLSCDDFLLKYGKASLSANGRIGEKIEMVFQGAVPDLGEIFEGYQADLSFSGSLSGEKNRPKLKFDFKGSKGNLDGIRFSSTQGSADVDLSAGGQVQIDASAKDITLGELTVSSAEIQGAGEAGDHKVYLSADSSLGDILVEGRGAYDPDSVFWKGVFQRIDLDLQKYGEWRLDNEISVEYGKEKSKISGACIGSDLGVLCLDASLGSDETWQVKGNVEQVSLVRLQEAGLFNIDVEGELKGSLEASGRGGKLDSLDGGLLAPLLQVVDRESGNLKTFQFVNNTLQASLEEGELKVNVLSSLPEGGNIKGVLFATRSTDGSLVATDSTLRGNVSFNAQDLGFLSVLTDGWLEPAGKMVGDLEIAGTVKEPKVKGNVAIPDGFVWITDLGVSLEDLSVKLNNQEEKIGYEISAKSGPGMAIGRGHFVIDDELGPLLNARFTGDDFLIMATEEYYIRVNPDVELNLGGGVKSVTGNLAIPHARIKLQASEGGISPSADVVIVDVDGKEESANGKFVINMNITAGDDVTIDAYGLESKITGNLTLTDYPGKPMSALGELQVREGKFALYSTELDIIRGRLYFSGGPVENPGVDFRAERKIEEKRVGVDVSGTAQEMEFNLYSDPFMGESDILAYMLVGSSLQTTSADDQGLIGSAATALGIKGVNTITSSLQKFIPIDEIYLDGSSSVEDMSLVLGKHITEDLFIGYDHNFFDNTGEFRAKYNLGWGFSVETARSVNSTSGDLFFSIER